MRIVAVIGSACVLAFLLAGCATSGTEREQRARILGKLTANPSAIVAAELSFARLAQKKGQWTAFRETAADDAVMFAPKLVNAQQWLKNKTDPPKAVEWQPHKIYISCDGSMGASIGAWQGADGKSGYFTTIWRAEDFGKQKRPGKKTEWKWVFDHGVPLSKPLEEPDFIETKVAKCDSALRSLTVKEPLSGDSRNGFSDDRTLSWKAITHADRSRSLEVQLWNGEAFETHVRREMKAP